MLGRGGGEGGGDRCTRVASYTSCYMKGKIVDEELKKEKKKKIINGIDFASKRYSNQMVEI